MASQPAWDSVWCILAQSGQKVLERNSAPIGPCAYDEHKQSGGVCMKKDDNGSISRGKFLAAVPVLRRPYRCCDAASPGRKRNRQLRLWRRTGKTHTRPGSRIGGRTHGKVPHSAYRSFGNTGAPWRDHRAGDIGERDEHKRPHSSGPPRPLFGKLRWHVSRPRFPRTKTPSSNIRPNHDSRGLKQHAAQRLLPDIS